MLRHYLNNFCTAYIDNIFIYTNSSLRQHQEHINKVLTSLGEAGLYVDIQKLEFKCLLTKYLGFIIKVGKGIRMDLEKVKAITE